MGICFQFQKIESLDSDIKMELQYIRSKFHDIVSFKVQFCQFLKEDLLSLCA